MSQRPARAGRSGARDPGAAVSLFVVAGVRLHGEGLASLIRAATPLRVAGVGLPCEDTLRRIAASSPRVVLIDAGDARERGFAHHLTRVAPESALLALGVGKEEGALFECAEAGVRGYLDREAAPAELVEAVLELANGEFHCPPFVAAILLRHLRAPPGRAQGGDAGWHLTPREREIVALIDRGLTNKEIAAQLRIEVPTVKNHVHHLLEKLGVRRRAAAAAKLRLEASGSKDPVPMDQPRPA